MKYKHKFYIVNKLIRNETKEIASCSDEMTANYLADHFRNVYENNFNVVCGRSHRPQAFCKAKW